MENSVRGLEDKRVCTQVSWGAAHRGQEGNTNGRSLLILSEIPNGMTMMIKGK